MKRIEGERLYYREITEADTDMVLKWRNSDAVRANFIYQPLITREEHLNWLATKVATGRVIQFIMVEKETETPVGSVYLQGIDKEAEKAEYGIFIGEESARGKGYGTEAATAMIQYAFEELHMHKLSLRVLEKNTQAIRSYEKAGFHIEGKMIDELKINGQYQTLIFMAVIAENNE